MSFPIRCPAIYLVVLDTGVLQPLLIVCCHISIGIDSSREFRLTNTLLESSLDALPWSMQVEPREKARESRNAAYGKVKPTVQRLSIYLPIGTARNHGCANRFSFASPRLADVASMNAIDSCPAVYGV